MKPIRISMTAFGPYRDIETIDFEALEDRRLFVISGNTGAGKTTIFDAICFALYGSASGEDRAEPRMLRSHFADDDIHTSVDYHFAVGARTYRVFRQMPHRRGANKSETGGKAELYETTGGEEVPCIDRFTVSDVNVKLESLLGLTREQFGQIVMLPQGEFRKLLTSDTENKEEILRRIFRTGLYQKVEDRFQRQNRELQEALKQAKTQQDVYAKQAQQSLPQREGSALAATLLQEYSSMAQVSDGLTQEIAYYEALAKEIGRGKADLEGQLQQSEQILREALTLEARFAQLAEKRQQLQHLEARKAEADESERRLTLAEKAARLLPYEEQSLAAARQAEQKRETLERKQRDLAEVERAHADAELSYRREEARSEERKEAERELTRLVELKPLVQTLDERRLEVERLTAQEKAVNERRTTADRQLESQREERRVSADHLKLAETEAAQLPEMAERYERLRSKYKLLKELDELDRRLESWTKHEGELQSAAAEIKKEHDRAETLWLEGQAGLLAEHLHDGKPCPVCGSESHPAKAVPASSIPTREQLQQVKEKLRAVERELGDAQAQAAAASTGRSGRAELIAEYEITDEPLSEQLIRAEAEGKKVRQETDRLKQQAEAVRSRRLEVEKLDVQLERLQTEREQLLTEQHRLSMERSAKQSVLENELGRVPESLRSPDKLEIRNREQSALIERLNALWAEAQRKLQSTQNQLVEEKANFVQLSNQRQESELHLKQAEERLAEELEKAGFGTVESYRAAKMAEADRERLSALIEQFKLQMTTVTRHIAELEHELSDKIRPDTAALQAAMEELKARLEQIVAELHAVGGHEREARRLLAAIAEAEAQFRDLEQRQQQVADIYQMLKGDNSQKISFERYILIEFLEQILHAANVRLTDLSNGQFRLERSDRLESRGKQSGLGLDVFDAYTGQNRDVKSLSGGEKFNASLCLALGMTDVIQAYQGGVSIEMMFIDEGFGSLDEDSLNKAIAALVDLQRAGRMIGVISHVQELKTAFPAVLEVSKTKEGHSRTKFIVK
ncbi:SMC family ATPase [Cohnella sp. LGH]|uniref:AAA family ATPase n=1 Tax=Cohnella sp. LGH TaxID=1619153 RepID=UPI001ADC7F74|nr:SMC family ATPase [Cohnella sp. LGH]QTH44172.1 SMC family ATPase [Cohnella sp. LGH]